MVSDVSKYGIDLAMAEELKNLRSFEDAEILAKEAIELAGHTQEVDNDYRSFAQGVLGDILYAEGKFKESAEMFRRTVRSYERNHYASKGPAELELLGALQLIGSLYMNSEQYEEAIKAFSSSLNVSKSLGPESIEVIQCLVQLGSAYYNNGTLEEAENLYQQALSIYDERIPVVKRDDVQNINTLGLIYMGLGHIHYQSYRDATAEEFYNKVEELFFSAGTNLADLAPALKNLAFINMSKHNYEKADQLMQECVYALQTSGQYGEDHQMMDEIQTILQAIRKHVGPSGPKF